MKKFPLPFCLSATLLVLGLCFGAVSSARAQALALIANGSFEDNPVGAAIGSPPDLEDITTYSNFRFFNVTGSALGTSIPFGSQIIAGGSVGSKAMRLDVNNTKAAGAGSYGLDIFNSRIPIKPGKTYQLVFDAAFIGGGNTLTVIAAEFDSTGAFTGEQKIQDFTLISTDSLYHTYTLVFTVNNPAAVDVDLTFCPGAGKNTANALSLDNLRFGTVPAEKVGSTASAKPAQK